MLKIKLKFYQKPSCTTCRKAKAFLEDEGAELELRDLDKQPLSEKELDELIGTRDYKTFLSTRNELYREGNMGEEPPSKDEAIRLMAKHPNLIKRPIAVRGDDVVLGFDVTAYLRLMK